MFYQVQKHTVGEKHLCGNYNVPAIVKLVQSRILFVGNYAHVSIYEHILLETSNTHFQKYAKTRRISLCLDNTPTKITVDGIV